MSTITAHSVTQVVILGGDVRYQVLMRTFYSRPSGDGVGYGSGNSAPNIVGHGISRGISDA